MSSKDGLDQAIKNLKKLPINIQKNVMRGAVRASANVIRDEAKKQAPMGEDRKNPDGTWHEAGTLAKSIVTKGGRPKNKNEVKAGVGIKYDKTYNLAWYAHFIEYGTRKQEANPFMRRAFGSKGSASVAVARSYIAKRLPKELLKLKVK